VHVPGLPSAPSLPSMVTVVSCGVLLSGGLQETVSWPVQVTISVLADAPDWFSQQRPGIPARNAAPPAT